MVYQPMARLVSSQTLEAEERPHGMPRCAKRCGVRVRSTALSAGVKAANCEGGLETPDFWTTGYW
jgi:hypothetical protein